MLIVRLSSRTLVSLSFQETQTSLRDASNLRAWATSLFWIKVLNAALPSTSAFKISFVTAAWARAPEEMQNRSSCIELNFKRIY